MDDATDSRAGEALDLLFVYGSLRRGCDNDEARALHAGADWAGIGWVWGFLGEIDGYPVLTPDAAGERVEGDLFHMRDPAALLALLDVYEGCAPGSPPLYGYRRTVIAVRTETGDCHALAYVAAAPTAHA